MTLEEGEELLEKIRRIRDEFFLRSARGRYYAEMYSSCSDEIIAGILGNSQTTLQALALMEDAAERLDNLEYYFSSGEPIVDKNFVSLTRAILEELSSHTSPEMLSNIKIIDNDIEMVKGMSIQELLDYFEFE